MRRDKSGLRNLVLITQLGFHVVTPIFLCLFVGIWLDRRLGTSILALLFLILGVLSGGLSAYKLAKQAIDQEKQALEKEQSAKKQEWEQRYGTGDGAGRNKREDW